MSWFLSATLLGATACCACAGPPRLPSLSFRAIAIVHDRTSAEHKRSVDCALTAQLTWFADTNTSADLASQLTPEAQLFDETLNCSEPALCVWASTAERSTLLALGVLQ